MGFVGFWGVFYWFLLVFCWILKPKVEGVDWVVFGGNPFSGGSWTLRRSFFFFSGGQVDHSKVMVGLFFLFLSSVFFDYSRLFWDDLLFL